jgi:hypothetical protein
MDLEHPGILIRGVIVVGIILTATILPGLLAEWLPAGAGEEVDGQAR